MLSALNVRFCSSFLKNEVGGRRELVLSRKSAENNLLGAAIAADASYGILEKLQRGSMLSFPFTHTAMRRN